MNRIKKWLSGWLVALFTVVLALLSVTGCGSGVDGELLAEIGIAVLEEYAASGVTEDVDEASILLSDSEEEGRQRQEEIEIGEIETDSKGDEAFAGADEAGPEDRSSQGEDSKKESESEIK